MLPAASDEVNLFFNRGIAHAQLKARNKAIADYTEALRLAPDLAIALYNRGYEFELSGKTDQALADYRRALEIEPRLQQRSLRWSRFRPPTCPSRYAAQLEHSQPYSSHA